MIGDCLGDCGVGFCAVPEALGVICEVEVGPGLLDVCEVCLM